MPRRNRGRDRRRQRPTPGYTWVGNKLVPITSTPTTEPVEPKKETPSWSDFGPDSLAPGETEVPSFEEEIEQHQETQQAAAIQERESSILTTHEPSQAEKDYYAALEAGETPEITQDHLNEIGLGEGGEGLTEDDVGEGEDPHWSDPTLGGGGHENAPDTTDPLSTHTDTTQWTAENQPTKEELSGDSPVTDTTPNALAGGSLMAGGKSSASSIGGGYGKQRKREISRGQMNLTQGRNRSLLTSI